MHVPELADIDPTDSTDEEFLEYVNSSRSVHDIMDVFQEEMDNFKAFRSGDANWAKLSATLNQVVEVVIPLNELVGNVASSVCCVS